MKSLFALVGLWLVLLSHAVSAQLDSQKADVRVIIDISGSMKQNDPENLRRPALDLLIKMIPDGSKAGVWTFGQYVNMLVPHRTVDDAWRAAAMGKVAQVNSVGLLTNIGGALERAIKDGGKPEAGFSTHVILLTDGMVDVSREPAENAKEWRRIVDQVLPSLQGQHVKLHTVALSDNADRELMNALSLGTDGIAAVANSATELSKIFMRALAQSAPADEVALAENKFLVDSSIEEFTALIFRAVPAQQTQLLSPDQKFYGADTQDPYVAWFRASDHDLITIKQPIEGEWLVRADIDPDSKVTIVTNLKLLVKPMANNLFEGEAVALQFLLQDKGNTLADARFLRLLNIEVALLQDGGVVWSEKLSDKLPPGDGVYRRTLNEFATEGRYQLRLKVDGKSFSREYTHHIAVRAPFTVVREPADNGDQLIRVSANGQSLDRERTVVVAKVREPNGRASIQPLVLTATDSWELTLSPDQDGVYEVDLRISAIDSTGASFEHRPPAISFRYPGGLDPFAQNAPQPSQASIAPEPEPSSAEEAPAVDKPEVVVAPQADGGEMKKWLLYGALAFGNLLILSLAYLAYRMVMGGKKAVEDDLAEDAEEALDAEIEAELSAAPALEDLVEDEEAAVDLESESAADDLAGVDSAPEFSLDDLAPGKDTDSDDQK